MIFKKCQEKSQRKLIFKQRPEGEKGVSHLGFCGEFFMQNELQVPRPQGVADLVFRRTEQVVFAMSIGK